MSLLVEVDCLFSPAFKFQLSFRKFAFFSCSLMLFSWLRSVLASSLSVCSLLSRIVCSSFSHLVERFFVCFDNYVTKPVAVVSCCTWCFITMRRVTHHRHLQILIVSGIPDTRSWSVRPVSTRGGLFAGIPPKDYISQRVILSRGYPVTVT